LVILGRATPAGTREFADKAVAKGADPKHFRNFRSLRLSSLGVGTYLGEPDAKTDWLVEEAVYDSAMSGSANVIDTAINYRLQKAERSVGRALTRLLQDGVSRESILLCTKNGYLTSDADIPLEFWTYIHRELVKPGKLKPEEIAGDSHSMHLPFLKDQFDRSLKNLGVESVDVLYLHNAAESWLGEIGYRRFVDRLEGVFGYYEEERRRGRLLYYGLASWTCFRATIGDLEHLNLDDVVDAARNVGGEEHGFRFIQLPFSVAMTEALTLRNQRIADERVTAFEAAERLGVGVFVSAPLAEGRLLGHPQVPEIQGSKALSLLQFVRSASPAIIAPLVGHKDPAHVRENLRLSSIAPLAPDDFEKSYGQLIGGGQEFLSRPV